MCRRRVLGRGQAIKIPVDDRRATVRPAHPVPFLFQSIQSTAAIRLPLDAKKSKIVIVFSNINTGNMWTLHLVTT